MTKARFAALVSFAVGGIAVACGNGGETDRGGQAVGGDVDPDGDAAPSADAGGDTSSAADAGPADAAPDADASVFRGCHAGGDAGTCPGVDLANDPHNCGACAHDCLGGACAGGACQPIVFADNERFPYDIAVDGTNVYWTEINGDAVHACPAAGCGASSTFAPGQSPTGIAVDAKAVYWLVAVSDGGAPAVMTCPLGGCPAAGPTWLANSGGGIGIASDGTNLFFGVTTLSRMQVDGGPVTPLTGGSGAGWIALDATSVYSSGWNGPTTLAKVNKDGSGGKTIASLGAAADVAVDAHSVYWTDQTAFSVFKADKDGSNVTTLATVASPPVGIAVDECNVYFTLTNGASVLRCAIGGCDGNPTVVASGQNGPWRIAVDATSVYWTNHGGNLGTHTVMKLAK